MGLYLEIMASLAAVASSSREIFSVIGSSVKILSLTRISPQAQRAFRCGKKAMSAYQQRRSRFFAETGWPSISSNCTTSGSTGVLERWAGAKRELLNGSTEEPLVEVPSGKNPREKPS